jgi:hypothetical protein
MDRARLEEGLMRAHEAGDTAAAQAFAQALRQMQPAPAASAAEPALAAPPKTAAEREMERVQGRVQTRKNIVTGALRGLMAPGTTIMRGLDALGGRPDDRAERVTQGLASMTGADPNSLGFGAGRLTGEVGSVAGLPAVMGAGAAAIGLPRVANALRTGGFAREPSMRALGNVGLRGSAGATVGGASGFAIDPDAATTLTGAMLGGALPVAGQAAGAAGRAVYTAFKPPKNVAVNQLMEAGGPEAIEALRRTQGMQTTPGFTATLSERLAAGGVSNPTVAAMERQLATLTPTLNREFNRIENVRVAALQQQLARIDRQLQDNAAAMSPQAATDLKSARDVLRRSLAEETAGADAANRALVAGLPDVGPLRPGEVLSGRAQQLRQETRKTVVNPAYERAFKAAGDSKVDLSPVIREAEEILGQPLSAFEPSTAPEIVRKLRALAPDAGSPLVLGPDGAPLAAVSGSADLRALDALRKTINADIAAAERGTGSLSPTTARNLTRLQSTLDNVVDGAATLTDDAKTAYREAVSLYRTEFAPRFREGVTGKMLQSSTFGSTRIMPERVVDSFLADQTAARQFATTFKDDLVAGAAMREGVEDAFRRSIVDPATGMVRPNAAAKFIEDHKYALAELEKTGLKVADNFRSIEREAARLAQGQSELTKAASRLKSPNAEQLVDDALAGAPQMNFLMRRLTKPAQEAVRKNLTDRALGLINGDDPQAAIKFLTDNAQALKVALPNVSQRADLMNAANMRLAYQKVAATAPKPAATILDDLTAGKSFTTKQLTDLQLVADDIQRIQQTQATARRAGTASPDVGDLAIAEAERTKTFTYRDVPPWFSSLLTIFKKQSDKIFGRISDEAAAELFHFMYRDPDAAISALENARKATQRKEQAMPTFRAMGRMAAPTAAAMTADD